MPPATQFRSEQQFCEMCFVQVRWFNDSMPGPGGENLGYRRTPGRFRILCLALAQSRQDYPQSPVRFGHENFEDVAQLPLKACGFCRRLHQVRLLKIKLEIVQSVLGNGKYYRVGIRWPLTGKVENHRETVLAVISEE